MKIFDKIIKTGLALGVAGFLFTSCNKLDLDPTATKTDSSTAPTIRALLNDPGFSILKAAVEKASTFSTTPSLLQLLDAPGVRYTFFAPDDAAFAASGIPSAAALAFFTPGALDTALRYHIVPQALYAASISSQFPNFQYPTIFNPAPSISPLLRLTTFPSKRGAAAWVNNVPVKGVDIQASNGVVHKVAAVVMPPSIDLWTKIQTDPQLTYLKAAITRADKDVPVGSRLQDALSIAANPLALASNLTVFAPVDAAMNAFLKGAVTKALVGLGVDPATAQVQAGQLVDGYGPLLLSDPASIPVYGPQLAAAVTPTLAKGIVAYHILSSQSGTFAPPGIRVFSVNIPTTATNVKTLLNSGGAPYTAHPGLTIQATFASGLPVVQSATVKGAANPTASNVIIGLTSSDQHCINGVLHKIDQALLPQ
ncbi:MAG: fasciclin domain-containing protein [Ferruginibacter sp.]